MLIATILKIPQLQDYLVLAVVVRVLSKHQSAFLFDCCIVIARFASLNCYSSVKTRIRLVKLNQINESFWSQPRCALLRKVYRFIVVLTRFRCPELQVCPLSSPRYRDLSPNPNPNPHLNHIFDFSIAFSHRVFCMIAFSQRVSVCNITVLTLRTCKSVQVPFNI